MTKERIGYLRRRLHPRLGCAFSTMLGVVLFSILAILFAPNPHARGELIKLLDFGMILLIPAISILYFGNTGYMVSWDEDFIYMRPPNWDWHLHRKPETSIRYGDIQQIIAPRDRRFGGNDPYSPSAAITITGTTTPPNMYNNVISVGFDYFQHDPILELMAFLRQKRPDLIPDDWHT